MAIILNQKSIAFDGMDDWIAVSAHSTIGNIFDGGGTLDAWIIINTHGGNLRLIHKQSAGWQLFTAGTSGSNTRLRFQMNFSGTDADFRMSGYDVPMDEWVHIRLEYDSSDVANLPTIYVNGESKSFTAVSAPTGTQSDDSATAMGIGATNLGAANWDGSIDELSLWTKTGISGTYNDGVPTDLSGNADYDTYCVAWWRMGDGDTYPTIEDQKNSNDGTMTNMASEDIADDVIVGTVFPDSVELAFTVEQPSVVPGSVTVSPNAVSMPFTVQEPSVTPGSVTVNPDTVELSYTVEQPFVSTGSVTVSPDTTALTFTVQQPSVSVGDATVSPDSVSLSFTVQEPSVSTGSVTVSPDTTSLSFTVQEPSVSTGDLTVNPDSVSLSFTVEQPSVSTGSVTVAPDTVGLTFTVQEPTVSQSTDEQTVSPNIVPLVFTVQEPTVTTGGVTVSPNVVALTFTVQEPVITDGIAIVDSNTVIAITRPYTTELSVARPYTIDIEIT